MDENLTRGYCQLHSGDTPQTRRIEIVSSPPAAGRGRYRARSQVLPPLDNCRLIYLALVLCGAGFLLPYNSFITAVDFYQVRTTQRGVHSQTRCNRLSNRLNDRLDNRLYGVNRVSVSL